MLKEVVVAYFKTLL